MSRAGILRAACGADLAVVVTDSTVTADGQTRHMRYVDVMAKTGGEWRFKSMIQAGWGDMLTQYLGAGTPAEAR